MKMPIVIFEDEQDKIDIDPEIRNDMISCIAHAIELENYFEFAFEVGITFTDNERICEINGAKRGKPVVTDVLSFPMFSKEELEKRDFSFDDCDPQNNSVILGDIIISLERAKTQAEEYGHSIRRELCFLAVHSTLHLLGYDHEDSSEIEEYMFSKQSEVLNDLNITRDM